MAVQPTSVMYSVVWERCTVLFLTQLILHRALDIVLPPCPERSVGSGGSTVLYGTCMPMPCGDGLADAGSARNEIL